LSGYLELRDSFSFGYEKTASFEGLRFSILYLGATVEVDMLKGALDFDFLRDVFSF